MNKSLLEESKIIETIEKLSKNSFSILEFMETFKAMFPSEWKGLVKKIWSIWQEEKIHSGDISGKQALHVLT